jgi:hypothetical protein
VFTYIQLLRTSYIHRYADIVCMLATKPLSCHSLSLSHTHTHTLLHTHLHTLTHLHTHLHTHTHTHLHTHIMYVHTLQLSGYIRLWTIHTHTHIWLQCPAAVYNATKHAYICTYLNISLIQTKQSPYMYACIPRKQMYMCYYKSSKELHITVSRGFFVISG